LTDTNSTSGPDDVGIKWLGVAASPNKRVFEVTNRKDEMAANNAAISVCEQASGRTCTEAGMTSNSDCSGSVVGAVRDGGCLGEPSGDLTVVWNAPISGTVPSAMCKLFYTTCRSEAKPR
jgi:hypothetical protein